MEMGTGKKKMSGRQRRKSNKGKTEGDVKEVEVEKQRGGG